MSGAGRLPVVTTSLRPHHVLLKHFCTCVYVCVCVNVYVRVRVYGVTFSFLTLGTRPETRPSGTPTRIPLVSPPRRQRVRRRIFVEDVLTTRGL